jgi:hypothetical protein
VEPPSEPRRGQRFRMEPPRGRWIPAATDLRVVLARNSSGAVYLTCPEVYPEGLRLDLTLVVTEPWSEPAMRRRWSTEEAEVDWLALELSWPDGSSASWGTSHRHPYLPDGTVPRLVGLTGEGTSQYFAQQLWLTPLPPAVPVTATLTCAELGGVHRSTLNLEAAVTAAGTSEPL